MSKRPTQKQNEARMRNHKIWRLRGLWWNMGLLDPDLKAMAQKAIDTQLVRLGAVTEQARDKVRRRELEKEFADG
jgi:hypothetical protein